MRIEVVHSPAARRVERRMLELPAGATVGAALQACGLLPADGPAGLLPLRIGLWGRRCTLEQPLRDGDRVELYRPLQIDPMEARRQRGKAAGRR